MNASTTLAQDLKHFTLILFGTVALLWGVLAVDAILGGALMRFGIFPRTMIGLRGIVFAPFLHMGARHLFGNTIGLVMLGGLVLLRDEADFWTVTVIGALVGGFGVWLLARPVMHIGASGMIFSYFGYLVSTGYFERRFGAILLSVVAVVLWGGLVFGVLPGQIGISWEGHLCGLLAGVLAAWLIARGKRRRIAN